MPGGILQLVNSGEWSLSEVLHDIVHNRRDIELFMGPQNIQESSGKGKGVRFQVRKGFKKDATGSWNNPGGGRGNWNNPNGGRGPTGKNGKDGTTGKKVPNQEQTQTQKARA